MTWFKVDDSFYDHPKAFDASDAAVALWLRAGTWSARNLTDGFVPDGMLARLSERATEAAAELVRRGLWRKARGGHKFHDWTDYNPTANDVRTQRQKRAEAGRKGGLASGKTRSKPEASAKASANADASRLLEPPSRPDPAPIGGRSTYVGSDRAREEPPPSRCPEHLDTPADGPCRPCGDARKAREQYYRDAATAAATAQSERARDQAAAGRAAIDACRLCDATGYRGAVLCAHNPDSPDRAARGAAAARAAIRRDTP